MDTGGACGARGLLPEAGQPGEVQIGLIGDDAGPPLTGRRTESGRHDHAASLCQRQLLLVFGMAQKTDGVGRSRLQWGDAGHAQRRVSDEFAAECLNNLPQMQDHACHPAHLPVLPEAALAAFKALITLSVMSCLGLM